MRRVEITREDGSEVRAYELASAKHLQGYGVYELMDGEGALLYIGRTASLASRLRQHQRGQTWWSDVAWFAWTPCADYAEAVAMEAMAIATSEALHNSKSVLDHDENRARQILPESAAHRLRGLYALSDTTDGTALTDSYMLALRDAGWSLQAIATPLGITRERVRQRATAAARDLDLVVPSPPPAARHRRRKVWPHLSFQEAERLRTLHESASRLRGGHGPGHPYRVASIDLSEAIAEARIRGVRAREIADAIGVQTVTVTMRMRTHGYMKTPPSQLKFESKTWRQPKRDECKRGHVMAGDNLRLVNGDPSKRVCRACERIRVAAYQERSAS